MRNLLRLQGCRPEPMASYLKSLAVLRLVSEQADSAARGYWDGPVFCLESKFDERSLADFFLDEYCPTPIVAPWNGGSGFYEGDRPDGFEAILASGSERFRLYRETIETVQAFPEIPARNLPLRELLARVESSPLKKADLDLAANVRAGLSSLRSCPVDPLEQTVEQFETWKDSLPKGSAHARQCGDLLKSVRKLRTAAKKTGGGTKEEIVLACRNRLCDGAVDWVDAAIVLRSAGDLAYPPILGTAGNEGRLDYTNNFMCRLRELLLERDTRSAELLGNALFAHSTGSLIDASAGQYDPGRAGGYNQGPGITHATPVNPWTFVLALEGCVAWASGVVRRQAVGARRLASSPFTVEARAVGYSSAADKDGEAARAEVWMPVWDRPTTFEELRYLLREGRAEIGRKQASDGLQFAEAAASLGVDRGITGFVRYSVLKRRGDSYVALPAAHFPVRAWREVDLLQDLDPLLADLDSRSPATARAVSARREIEKAMYEFLLHGGKTRFRSILAALGRLEQALSFDHRAFNLRPEWLLAADDGSPEFRIAAALASIGPTGDVGPLRANLDRRGRSAAWTGNRLAVRLASVLQRRMMDAERLNAPGSPLWSTLAVRPEDVACFLDGGTDDGLLEQFLFGLSLVRWHEPEAIARVRPALREAWRAAVRPARIPRSWALLKHLFLPGRFVAGNGSEVSIRAEPALVPLLCANRVREACRIARRRLFSGGLNPTSTEFPDGEDGVRIAAALLVPLDSAHEISRLVLASSQTNQRNER